MLAKKIKSIGLRAATIVTLVHALIKTLDFFFIKRKKKLIRCLQPEIIRH